MESPLLIRDLETVPHRTRFLFIILALTVLTLGAFWPVCNFEFVNYDDDRYLYRNPHLADGFSARGLEWIFSADLVYDSPHVDYWQPVTLFSRMLDVQLFGMDSAGHHRMNLIFHILNVLLLFTGLNRLTGSLGRSAAIAGLFAIHPLQVEAVAWITARKDLLSTFFGLLAIGAYLKGARAPVIFLFLLSLMSKPMLVTLPLLLMLLDYWRLGRVKFDSFKAVLVGFSLLFSVLPFLGQPLALSHASPAQVLLNIPIRYLTYLKKMIYPAPLAVYGLSLEIPPLWQVAGASLFLIGISMGAFFQSRLRPYLAVGWFWYLAALGPTITAQRFEDRFMYFPMIGLLLAGVGGLCDLPSPSPLPLWGRGLKGLLVILIFSFLIPVTFAQVRHWKDSVALFTHSVSVTSQNFLAHNQLCAAWLDQGEFEKAKSQCLAALQVHSDLPEVHFNLGLVFTGENQLDQAIHHYRTALSLRPNYLKARRNLARVLWLRERQEERGS